MTYFDPEKQDDAEAVIRSLTIRTEAPVLGNSFTGGAAVCEITAKEDAEKLERHAGVPGLGALISAQTLASISRQQTIATGPTT